MKAKRHDSDITRTQFGCAGIERASVLFSLLAIAACSAPSRAVCNGVSQAAIVNGSVDEEYLGASGDELRSIVQVVDATRGADGPLCSGVFVARNWVVTAAHCLAIESANVVVASADGAGAALLPVVQARAAPDADAALLQVDPSTLAGTAPADIGALTPGAAELAASGRVEISGYGLTETGATRELRFAVESITSVNALSVTVDGHGGSGACDGDSGGPLLLRDDDGALRVAGVLSLGSATCRDDDTYVRLDALSDWLASVTGPLPAAATTCGQITDQGRCFDELAVWCEDGSLRATRCTGHETCGLDAATGNARCVSAAADCGAASVEGAP